MATKTVTTLPRQLKSALQWQRPWPANLQESDRSFFAPNQQVRLEGSELLQLQDVNVLADGVVFRHLYAYPETFIYSDFQLHNWRGLAYIYLKFAQHQLPADFRYVIAHHAWAVNYYHWMVDVLPRLEAIKELLPDLTLLLPANYNKEYHRATLQALGVRRVQWLQPHTRYRVPELLVPTRMARVTDSRPDAMLALRQTLLNYFQPDPAQGLGERIYISRARAPRRKVVNEDAVCEYLRQQGFAIVYFEDYSFQQQVSIAAQARYLISIHGAGLTNMLFMPANSRVMELQMRDDGTCYFYYALATGLGLDYFYQFCEPTNPGEIVNTADLIVDLPLLARNVECMLASA
ncbi:glycosyltransferase family 61 protein [Hymenobacter busanensis]|uniref:Glycosyltransferase family 61 protein n=1 Tax=Hymenobacter busanensis TaxID=2607656 RepID=A0A7L4ZZ10_9BACT|nr:glycosyltransferase family 61 protein [Hymenobacter busanensis]KAA9332271.1 glycosyltransferase family 61 protein [Hymenobacter busanensis]QHJ07392.1 DUF563 domain-containing protein [Hymenobacter busanensis]